MARFAARRLLGMLVVLFAVSVIVFLIFNVIPNSDPAARIAGEKSAGNAQLIASINEEWGFDESLPAQYVSMMKKLFSGNLISYQTHTNVNEEIIAGVPAHALTLYRSGGDMDVLRAALRLPVCCGGLSDRLRRSWRWSGYRCLSSGWPGSSSST